MKEELIKHFNNLELPSVVQNWLLNLWDVIQGLDDWYDNDKVTDDIKQEVIYKTLVSLPANPFFLDNAENLLPVLNLLVGQWVAANKMEKEGNPTEVSFVWRATYYSVVLTCVQLIHGFNGTSKVADYVAKMYGESYEDYLKEFTNA